MEPQVSIALPQKEHNEMEIISSTQWPTFAQVFLIKYVMAPIYITSASPSFTNKNKREGRGGETE